MVRGTTQEFKIKFAKGNIDIKSITSYCLAFGKTETKKVFDIYEKRNEGTNTVVVNGVTETDSNSKIHFNRAYIEATTEGNTNYLVFCLKLTELESLSLKAGEAYVQLKLGIGDSDVISSEAKSFEVLDTLCSKEIEDHE